MSETVVHRTPIPASEDKAFFGHPKGLAVLFATEMWERFSYYGMRALLIFYLTQHFLFSDQRSALIYGAYTALVYVMPVIGGILADRYLGSRKAVTFGAILLVAGHTGMAFEGSTAQQFVDLGADRYEVVTEGRGDASSRFVTLDNGRAELKRTDDGYVLVTEQAAEVEASEIASYTAADVAFSEERDGLFLNIFYLSLALIISGVGFLKANISTIVGALYDKDDPRRDGGFTIFYMGINLGSFLAVLACGYLGERFGWAYGFGLAGIGMLIGLVIFLRGQHLLHGRADPPDAERLKRPFLGPINLEWTVYLGGALMVLVSFLLVKNEGFVGDLLNGFGLLMAGVILFATLFLFEDDRPVSAKPVRLALFVGSFVLLGVLVLTSVASNVLEANGGSGYDFPNFSYLALVGASGTPVGFLTDLLNNGVATTGLLLLIAAIVMAIVTTPSHERDRMLVLSFLILLQIPFWSLFEQAGSSLNLFAQRATERDLFGFEVPASWFQSLNALFIFTLAPLFAWTWLRLAKAGLEPSTPVKFALGILQVGLGFFVLVAGIEASGQSALVPMIFVILLYLLHTTGELCLSPVGLSAVTKLAIPKVVGMMMGAWFLASAFGNYVAGQIAASTGAETIGGEIVDLAAAKATYAEVYTSVAWVAVGIAVFVLIVSPLARKGMHGIK